MASMVDRMAEIIAAGVADDLPSDEIAQRVLAAMREPTEAMWAAFVEANTTDPEAQYRAMIDAAAKD